MFKTVISAIVLYIAASIDLLVILLIFFAKVQTKKEIKDIYIGQYIGSTLLIFISLFFAFVVKYVPDKWLLGLLGFIPIYLGIKTAIAGDCDGERRAKYELKKRGLLKLVKTVATVTVASCGADNIGLFVPYFVTLNITELLVTLLIFLLLIFMMIYTAQKLVNIRSVGDTIERFSRWIMAIVYIGLGLSIIIENNTIEIISSLLWR